MHAIHPDHMELPSKVLQNLLTPAGSAFAIFVLFIVFQYIFQLDFQCPCDPYYNKLYCSLYLVLPFILIFLILMLVDPRCMKIHCRDNGHTLTSKLKFYCNMIFRRTLMSACAGSLWVITVFIEGGWYVCIVTTNGNNTAAHLQIACEEEKNMTPEEARNYFRTINESRAIGLGCILIIVFLWTVVKCVTGCCTSYYQNMYYKYLEAGTDTFIQKKFKEQANENAEDRYNSMLRDKGGIDFTTMSDPMFHLAPPATTIGTTTATGTITNGGTTITTTTKQYNLTGI